MIKEQIKQIIEKFGMDAKTCAIAMSITTQTFRNKMSDKNDRHKFNEKNLQNLKKYLKTEAEKL